MEISLTYKQSGTKDGLYAYALHIEATFPQDSAEAHPAYIFVIRRSTPTMNPYGQTDRMVDDEFFNVATPVDMYDVPSKEPDIEHGMPYYRDCKVDLWFRNLEDLLRAKAVIGEDVAALARLWDNISDDKHFEHEETVVYGA